MMRLTYGAVRSMVNRMDGLDLDTLGALLGVERYGGYLQRDDTWYRYRLLMHILANWDVEC